MLEYAFSGVIEEIQDQNRSGVESMFVSALHCDENLALLLLDNNGLDATFTPLHDGTTPLMVAAYSNCHPVLSVLLSHLSEHFYSSEDLMSHLESTAAHGLSALMVGSLRESTKCVKLLLKQGVDPSQKHAFAQTTSLHMAAELGHESILRLLCTHGANSSATTSVGGTALHTAAQVNMARSVTPLVHICNLSPDVLMLGDTTALYIAAQNGHDAVVSALLSVGADIEYAMPVAADGMAALANNGLVKYSSSSDAEDGLHAVPPINSEAANGATALHAAAENGHASVVELLLSHISVLASTTPNRVLDFVNGQSLGVTPLHLAAQYDRQQVASVLLSGGALIDALATVDGTSALYHAISGRHASMALFLVEAGASCLVSPLASSSSSPGGGGGGGGHATSRTIKRTSPLILTVMRQTVAGSAACHAETATSWCQPHRRCRSVRLALECAVGG